MGTERRASGFEASDPDNILPAHSVAWQISPEIQPERLVAYLDDAAATPGVQQAARIAMERLQLAPGLRVLDVGCGTGIFLPALARSVGPEGFVAGLDHAPALLREARERLVRLGLSDRVSLQVGDAAQMPFPDATFDRVHISRVLIHVEDPSAVVREMRRVTKAGGWIVAVEPDFASLRIDHPDQEAARALVAGFCQGIRNPSLGLELWRRLAEVGLEERQVDVVSEIDTEYTEETASYDRRNMERAVGAGLISPERAEAALDYLAKVGRQGHYAAYSSLIIAAGKVPAA
ncbi:MAG TPA: methyltransferase domain-containing protein [Thermomicrobiales bacterium]